MDIEIRLSTTPKMHNLLVASYAVSILIIRICSSPFCLAEVDGSVDSTSMGVTCFTLAIDNKRRKVLKTKEKDEKTKRVRLIQDAKTKMSLFSKKGNFEKLNDARLPIHQTAGNNMSS